MFSSYSRSNTCTVFKNKTTLFNADTLVSIIINFPLVWTFECAKKETATAHEIKSTNDRNVTV